MTAVLGVFAAVSVSLPLSIAGAAGGAIVNGDFETDPLESSTVTGWSFTNGLVDLGVTRLGGCVSQDTSSYSTLRDYADEASPRLNAQIPVGPDDEVFAPGTTDEVWLDGSGARTTPGEEGAYQLFFGDGTFDDGDGWVQEFRDFYILIEGHPVPVQWSADVMGNYNLSNGFYDDIYPDYSSVPDPAVRADNVPPVTDTDYWQSEGDGPTFESKIVGPDADSDDDEDMLTASDEGGSDLSPASQALRLSSDMDSGDEGYVAHGPAAVSDPFTSSGNKTISLDWAASGASDDYHVLGYVLNVDTCQQTEVLDSTGEDSDWQTTSVSLPQAGTYRFVFVAGTYDESWGGAAGALLYVDNIRALPTITGAGIDLEPLFGTGDTVASAPIQLTGGGLKANSPWTAELHSTPVTLASGTTDASGNFWLLSSLPASVEAGRHQIILSGIAPDGTPLTDTVWITVTASGTLGYVSLAAEEGTGGGTGTPPAAGGGQPSTGGGGQPVASTPQPAAAPAAAPAATVTTAPRSGLAMTGFESLTFLGMGAALVAVGGVVLVAARRRARRA